MPEMREDMLPDAEATVNDIKEEIKTPQVELTDEDPATPAPEKSDIPKGMVPYQALDEERRKRKDLEKKLKQLESSSSVIPDDQLSDEGRLLKQEIQKAQDKISELEAEKQRDQVYSKYPQIADKAGEFEDFREEYPTLPLEKVAKLFIAEKNLFDAPKRKGLERPTSGPKTQHDEEFSSDDISRLMKGDEKKFVKLIRQGKFDQMKFK